MSMMVPQFLGVWCVFLRESEFSFFTLKINLQMWKSNECSFLVCLFLFLSFKCYSLADVRKWMNFLLSVSG